MHDCEVLEQKVSEEVLERRDRLHSAYNYARYSFRGNKRTETQLILTCRH